MLLLLCAGFGKAARLLQPQQGERKSHTRPDRRLQLRPFRPEHDGKHQAGDDHQKQRES